MFVPSADEINAMVRQVKLWFPPSHFVTSLDRCPVILANWLLVIPFCFITASILAAIPSVSADVALSSGVIFASSSFNMSSYISVIGQNLPVLFLLLPSVQLLLYHHAEPVLATRQTSAIAPETAIAVFWYISNENQHFMALKKPLCRGFSVVCGRFELSTSSV